jgi:hypothetical protein
MTYRGTMKNGVIVLEGPTGLMEGESVDVVPLSPQSISQGRQPTALQAALAKLAGTCPDLPRDIAENHDHYLHGTPKAV